MSNKYIIGIDGGSQSTKVVMYDLQGNIVCEEKACCNQCTPRMLIQPNILTMTYGLLYVLPEKI